MTVFGWVFGAIAVAMLALAACDLWGYFTGRTKPWRTAQQLTKDFYLFALFAVATAQAVGAISRDTTLESIAAVAVVWLLALRPVNERAHAEYMAGWDAIADAIRQRENNAGR